MNLTIKEIPLLDFISQIIIIFGSDTNENFTKNSDIDFLVSFNKPDLTLYFENYMALKEKLSKLFKREIDLVEEQTLKNPILIL